MLPRILRPLMATLLITALAASLVSASHCSQLYFDDFEGTNNWTPSNTGLNQWRLVDETVTPQPFGYNSFSRTHFWYVGAAALPSGITYLPLDGLEFIPSTLTSPTITLPSATGLEMKAYVAGGSEADSDFLHAYVDDGTSLTLEASVSGLRSYSTPISIDLDAYAGQSVKLVFEFTSDSLFQEGPGWNLDDVSVRDC